MWYVQERIDRLGILLCVKFLIAKFEHLFFLKTFANISLFSCYAYVHVYLRFELFFIMFSRLSFSRMSNMLAIFGTFICTYSLFAICV